MDIKQQILIAGILAMSFILWNNWQSFQEEKLNPQTALNQTQGLENTVPSAVQNATGNETPQAPNNSSIPGFVDQSGVNSFEAEGANNAQFITVETDLVTAVINTQGGSIESIVLKQEAKEAETPEIGYPLLKNTPAEIYVTQSGLIGNNGSYPNHTSVYTAQKNSYTFSADQSGDAELQVPLQWISPEGIRYIKTFIFKKDSYVIDINFSVNNTSSQAWQGFLYGQFKRSQPVDVKTGSFLQLPSYLGGIQYTPEDKYKKVDFDEIAKNNLSLNTNQGWIGMLQHYFAGVWMLKDSTEQASSYNFYSTYKNNPVRPEYIMGFKSLSPLVVQAGQSGNVETSVFIGPKEQNRLKKIQNEQGIEGLALTVDYGWLTVISDPLFWLLKTINNLVQNWGWSIIILTLLIKLAFFPLSAASYKSMARMKKLQPRIETLKERFGDDRAAMQQEMMKLYKTEKVNPAGGCLPMLIQIPVFIALYYVLLESVELRHAPFALWIQDLSSKDPYYILPILMGLSMLLQFRLNPTPMEPMQQRIMMIMPIAMTFLFVTFPAGLVLYWVVNNVLSIAQQWTINKTIIKDQ